MSYCHKTQPSTNSGQSKKTIGHESQIGPCVATQQVDNCQVWSFQKTNGVVTTVKWNHKGKETSRPLSSEETNRTPEEDHSQIVGACSISWAKCRVEKEKSFGTEPRKGVSLDIPLYRTLEPR